MTDQQCILCQQTRDECEKQLHDMRWTVEHMTRELEVAHVDRLAAIDENIRLKRKLYTLEHRDEEPQGHTRQKESDEIKEWLYAWDEIRRRIPGSRPVKDKTLGLDSSNAQLVKAARRIWSHDELMMCLRGAGVSDWWTENVKRFKVSTLIGNGPHSKREEKIADHIQRWQDYSRLIDSGMPEDMAHRMIQEGVNRVAHDANEAYARERDARIDVDYAVIRAARA